MTRIIAVNRDMKNRARMRAFMILRSDGFHQLRVADGDGSAVYRGFDSETGQFLIIIHRAAVRRVGERSLHRFRYRVGRISFGVGGEVEKHLLINSLRMHITDVEGAFCQRSRLVKYDGLCSGEYLKII